MDKWTIEPGRGKVRIYTASDGIIMYSNNSTKHHRENTYERTKRQVYATGNKWAIENFHATHD